MYYGGGLNGTNEQNKPLDHDFVSLLLKGRTDSFALKGGDATTGKFSTMYDGARPIRPHQKGIKNHGYQVSCTRWHPHKHICTCTVASRLDCSVVRDL